MIAMAPRQTARIYAFVPRGRAAAKGGRSEQVSGNDRIGEPVVCEFGSSWYHEAAIKDSERPRKS